MKETPPFLASSMDIFSPDTDCMIADTIGIFNVMAGSSPFLNFTSGVLIDTLAGMQSVPE